MASARDPNDHVWSGSHTFTGGMNIPASSVEDNQVSATANIGEEKLEHRRGFLHTQTGAVAALTENVFVAYRAGTLLSLKCEVDTVATGADRTVTVDIKKSTAAGAFASVCTPKVLNNGSVARTVYDVTLTGTPTFIEDDVLQIVVTVAGSASNQAIGLIVYGVVAENGA